MDFEKIYTNFPRIDLRKDKFVKESDYNEKFFYEDLSKNLNLIDGELIDYLIDRMIIDISALNQFVVFLKEDISLLKTAFVIFFNNYGDIITSAKRRVSLSESFKELEDKIYKVITDRNGDNVFIEENQTIINENYSGEFQKELLNLDLLNIKEPVLDIGCGLNGNLVKFLRLNGINCYGIDKYSLDYEWYIKSNWLDYDYGTNNWGTIISNMAFSNHFNYHLRNLNYHMVEIYKNKFLKILEGLIPEGCFIYSPEISNIDGVIGNFEKYHKTDFQAGNTNKMVSIIRKKY